MQAAISAAKEHGVLATCAAFDIPLATYYRHRAPMYGPRRRRPSPPRRLDDAERQVVLDVLHEPRFVDMAPAEVHATLLEEERYLCSVRTMHRILAENAEELERALDRAVQAEAPADEPAPAPELAFNLTGTVIMAAGGRAVLVLAIVVALRVLPDAVDARGPAQAARGRRWGAPTVCASSGVGGAGARRSSRPTCS
jgi:hypothetical protein